MYRNAGPGVSLLRRPTFAAALSSENPAVLCCDVHHSDTASPDIAYKWDLALEGKDTTDNRSLLTFGVTRGAARVSQRWDS